MGKNTAIRLNFISKMIFMNYYITLTTKCNMYCSYCYGKSCEDFGNNVELNIDYSLPQKIDYEIKDLIDFINHFIIRHCFKSDKTGKSDTFNRSLYVFYTTNN